MRLLILLILMSTTFFSYARNTNAPADENEISMCFTYIMPIALVLSLAVAGAVYLVETNNKRRRNREQNNSEKNT